MSTKKPAKSATSKITVSKPTESTTTETKPYYEKSYRDNLRALKKEREEAEKNKALTYEPIDDTTLFTSYLFDLSDESLMPIDRVLMYKKMFIKKHNYAVPRIENIQPVTFRFDCFVETEIFLPKMLEGHPAIDADFLTGYYFACTLLVRNKKAISFHAGLSKDDMLRGIFCAFAKKKSTTISGDRSLEWNFYGCDSNIIKGRKKLYINGVSKKCDVFDLNSIRSINIQIGETVKPKSFDFYIADVETQSVQEVLMLYFLCNGFVTDNGYIILRLPLDWNKFYTAMITTLIFFISQYKYVKIFKTPWGIKTKLYIILSQPKEILSQAKLNNIVSYIGALEDNPDLPLFNEDVFDIDAEEDQAEEQAKDEEEDQEEEDQEEDEEQADEEQADEEQEEDEDQEDENTPETLKDKSYMELLINNINNTYLQLSKFEESYEIEQANQLCIEMIEK